MKNLHLINNTIFDIDVHLIPENKKEQQHFHYDVRFVFVADGKADLLITSESKDLKWFTLDEVCKKLDNQSLHRMVLKTMKLRETIND